MKIQFALLVDCTSSMGPHIDNALEVFKSMMDQLRTTYSNWHVQVAFVGYRDFHDPPPMTLDFTSKLDLLVHTLADTEAFGGRDLCEDVHSGLIRTAHLSWDRGADVRSVLHLADAPAHGRRYHALNIDDDYPDISDDLDEIMFEDFAMRDIHYTFGGLSTTTFIMSDVFRDVYRKAADLGANVDYRDMDALGRRGMETAVSFALIRQMHLCTLSTT
jgi:hypothetical protein